MDIDRFTERSQGAPRQATENWLDRIGGDFRSNTADAKIENAFMGPGAGGGGSYEPFDYLKEHPGLARKVKNWWGDNSDKYGAWGKTVYGDIGDNGVWDQGEFSGTPGIQSALHDAFPRLGRAYDAAAGPADPYAGRAAVQPPPTVGTPLPMPSSFSPYPGGDSSGGWGGAGGKPPIGQAPEGYGGTGPRTPVMGNFGSGRRRKMRQSIRQNIRGRG